MNRFSFSRRHLLGAAVCLSLVASLGLSACAQETPTVSIARVPNGGLQPQVVVAGAVVHLIYFKGDPKAGDVFYVRSTDSGTTWTAPLRVNSGAGSAIAMGTIRGPMLSIGRGGRAFVVWNGSDKAMPRNPAAPASVQKYGAAPLLFSRLGDAGRAFEPQRNLITRTFNLDGGASVASDEEGRVYVAWHANDREDQDETGRRAFLATSTDDGTTFSPEKPVWNTLTGACGCCRVGIKAGRGGRVSLLYRSATELVHRDSYFLQSADGGQSFHGQKISDWDINACPMSSFVLAGSEKTSAIGWESAEKVYFSRLDAKGQPAQAVAAPGTGNNRKYPSLALGSNGKLLFAWTEDTSWNRGGKLRFQLFDAGNQPVGVAGQQDGVPAWSFATAFARPDGKFVVLY